MCNRHIYFSETCTVSLKYRFRLQIRFEKHRFHCSEHEFALHWFAVQFIDSFADFVQFNCTCAPPAEMPSMQICISHLLLIKKCLAKKCSSLPHFPRHFFHKKCLEKSVRCNRTIPDTFNISIQKLPGKKKFFSSALSQALSKCP